ncbi:nitroreductase family deazaflavin-dependent oxidoreductase [Streptomyces sp. NPDC085995]|uniref:nitroreductase family deazaflavin-dependent oxidoreductase n=1 Tax=Streptomyces sp. NPDC085995 TaxID=3154861 RepID=UPI0034125A79
MIHTQRTHRPAPPTGWRRLVARLPVLVYRMGLGALFGGRLLLLHHTGRVSGRDRQAVLEVVESDSRAGTWVVASGFGARAAWYQNLLVEPQTVIQSGNRHHAVTAHFLGPDEGADIMARYARRHPRTARRLCAFLGLPADGTDGDFRDAGRAIPFVLLRAGSGFRPL